MLPLLCNATTEAQEMAMSKSEELGVKCVPSLNLVYTQVRHSTHALTIHTLPCNCGLKLELCSITELVIMLMLTSSDNAVFEAANSSHSSEQCCTVQQSCTAGIGTACLITFALRLT
jgi:hypothetical protein